MLNRVLIEGHLMKMGLSDFEISSVEGDGKGDYIKAFLPELEFSLIKDKVFKHKYYRTYLGNFSSNSIDFSITEEIDGYRVIYKLTITKESFGVSISGLVKRIDFYDSRGRYVPVLGFEMLKEFVKLDEEKEELLNLTSNI